jgi:polar amino acid transport system substrate-binding protein
LKIITLIYCCLLSFLSIAAKADIPSSISLAATDWCPYTCNSQQEPGIVVEYLQEILAPYNISLDIQYLPWKRAIREVQIGKISGLVTAVSSEAPNLLFTSEATMGYSVCIYSQRSNDWQYIDTPSLKDQALGAALDYSYNESIDAYIEENKNTPKITFVLGEKKISRFYSMLKSNRIDAFISDRYVTAWNVKRYNISVGDIEVNKCFETNNFNFALNPNIPWGQELIDLLNTLLSRDDNKKILSNIIDRYTLDN